MIEDLKPYPQYKDSGLPWLGQVPEHWEIRPASGAFSPIRERNTGMKEKIILSLSYGRIVVKPAGKLHGLVPESFDTYQIVNPGVTVIRTTDLQNDKTSLRTGIVRDRGIITSAYLALSTSDGLLPEFGYQILNAWDITKAIYGYGSGLRQNLDFSDFRRMPVAVPPIAEQAFIARFLAWATNCLDRAIGAKRRIIALLQEQKQAIIHRAVMQGLDPSVPLKDSGIPWLGEIPEHWEVKKIRSLAEVYGGMTPSKSAERYWTGDTPWISPKDMKQFEITGSIAHISDAAVRETGIAAIPFPAVLFVVRGMILARKLPVAVTRIPVTLNQDMKGLMPRVDISAEYLAFLLSGAQKEILGLVEEAGHGTKCLRTDSWASFDVPLPARQEQNAICNFILSANSAIDNAALRLDSEITLLREYRTRLIADVVTGKLDVRELAAGLPEPQNVKGAQLEPEEEEPEFEDEDVEIESMD